MASTKEYLDFVLEQLSGLDEISNRAMMGEYILYYRERVFGGIYNDRLLVKPVPAEVKLVESMWEELRVKNFGLGFPWPKFFELIFMLINAFLMCECIATITLPDSYVETICAGVKLNLSAGGGWI